MRHICMLVFSLMFGASAYGQNDKVVGSLGLFKFTQSTEGENSNDVEVKTETDYQFVHLGFCYVTNQICLGLRYLDATIVEKDTYSDANYEWANGTSSIKYSGFGVKIGFSGDIGLILHYSLMLTPTMVVEDARTWSESTVTYNVKNASIIDVGYGFEVNNLRVGPLFSIIDFAADTYDDDDEQDVESPRTDSFLAPHIAFWIDF